MNVVHLLLAGHRYSDAVDSILECLDAVDRDAEVTGRLCCVYRFVLPQPRWVSVPRVSHVIRPPLASTRMLARRRATDRSNPFESYGTHRHTRSHFHEFRRASASDFTERDPRVFRESARPRERKRPNGSIPPRESDRGGREHAKRSIREITRTVGSLPNIHRKRGVVHSSYFSAVS